MFQLLGITFHKNPCNWDTHFHNTMGKANSRLCTLEELTILFYSLIISVFTYVIKVWACAYKGIFRKRAWKYGYTNKYISISDVIRDRDKQLWGKITDTQCLKDLLASKRTDRSLRQRGQDYKLHGLIASFAVALELIHSNIGGICQSAYNLIFLVETTQYH